MDTVRFLNFLQSFASSTSTRMQAQPESETLSSTLSAFESQLRALMAPDQPKTADAVMTVQTQASDGLVPAGVAVPPLAQAVDVPDSLPESASSSLFVIGGSAPASAVVAVPATAGDALPGAAAGASPVATPVVASGFKPPIEDLQKIVAWQREQIHPLLHVRVGDTWERQGIADPVNHPGLLAQAQQVYERAANFKAHMPGYVAAWEKPWQVPAPVQMAASEPDTSGFVTGGRG